MIKEIKNVSGGLQSLHPILGSLATSQVGISTISFAN